MCIEINLTLVFKILFFTEGAIEALNFETLNETQEETFTTEKEVTNEKCGKWQRSVN